MVYCAATTTTPASTAPSLHLCVHSKSLLALLFPCSSPFIVDLNSCALHCQLYWHPQTAYLTGKNHPQMTMWLSRTESTTSHIQRIPSPSPPKAAPKLKYSHVVESTLWPHDPGKLSPDWSCVQSHDISTTLRSRDIQTRDPGKVSYDLPRDWLSTWSQVATWSPDRAYFRCTPSPLIGMWKTVGMINKSMNQQTSHKTLERSKVAHLLPVFVPALKYGPPVWVCMPALNMYAQTTQY